MSDFKTRMFDEHSVLCDRVEKLEKFIPTAIFDGLPEIERLDLEEQLQYMQEYLRVLNRRVSRQFG